MHRRWLVNRTNKEFLEYFSRKASISPAFAQILVNRGIKDPESIKTFLSPSPESLHDPFLMPDMKIAVERIKVALDRNESILVHGDYDADGVTSTALLVSVLRGLGLKTYYHIPNRLTDGYGVSQKGIQKAKDCGASLLITVDCGISSEKEVLEARSHGIDVIITDHHEPPLVNGTLLNQKLPQAIAVINPRRNDSNYPFKYLAGVGVAYKLAQALLQDTGCRIQDAESENLLDLVAIGTIADSVPLTGENRILAAYGLKKLNNTCSVGIQALKEVAGLNNREVKSVLLSYTVVPRINAAGRLGDASEVVELFLTHDEARAKGIAGFLEEQNIKRQRIEGVVYNSALEMIGSNNIDKAIILYSPEWHEGVIGIVASRLAEEFYRPAFLFSIIPTNIGTIAKGSARSIPAFDLYKCIAECAGLLLSFGGHTYAAGIKLREENLVAFKSQVDRIVERDLTNDALTPMLEIDACVDLSEVNFNLVKELNLLEPFGNSNEEPVMGIKGIEVIEPRVVGNNHLKMRLRQKNISMDTIGFNMGDLLEQDDSRFVDAAFIPIINEWNGNKTIQLSLSGLRPSKGAESRNVGDV
ncbi:MAG: single-stranded-DNA-specific exonuclease RecJ [Nitrospirae bacterium]|nr:single-stranded-DNA-specific exonuclease RecJ [Nitrospirota bacterium]